MPEGGKRGLTGGAAGGWREAGKRRGGGADLGTCSPALS